MSITIVIVSTALASGVGASLAMFLIQKYYDRRLEYYFNSHLEELKASLNIQGDIKNQITAQRLEIYPAIAESVYRLRNSLREMNGCVRLPLDGALAFLRLAEQYTEQIYSARFYLELDGLFEPLHDYKDPVRQAKNVLLDWIYLTQERPSQDQTEMDRIFAQLQEANMQLEQQHRQLIQGLTRLAES